MLKATGRLIALPVVVGGVLAALVTGCGKVTQVSNKGPEPLTFDLRYSVSVTATSDPTYKTVSPNVFTVLDNPFFTTVIGIQKNGKMDELSWGKAVLSSRTGTGNTVVLRASAMRKGDVDIDGSDFSWTRLSFNPANQTWSADPKKIKLGYSLYLIAAYSQKGKAYLTLIDGKRPSGNGVITLPALTDYDTFITTLVLQDIQDEKGFVESAFTSNELRLFFTESWFESLTQYRLPVTTATQFSPENPTFVFGREFEKRLLSIYSLAKTGETDEAIQLMNKYKKETPSWLSTKAESGLVNQIKTIKPITPTEPKA